MITRLLAAISVLPARPNDRRIANHWRRFNPLLFGGKLFCQTLPAANVIDDLMATTTSEEDGRFEVAGKETEVTAIDPKVNIYHRCGGSKDDLRSKIDDILPLPYLDEWISRGSIPKKTFDLGVLVLDAVFAGEVTDCIH
ncbi:Transthyretin-like family-containing protein [Aphelenchoides fujianensis]|nr:Transthyretin-like family-containing protein [Aphelenchoides fujianensis]